jgi:predicted signal transduction protein with EAL and GGDEF domain
MQTEARKLDGDPGVVPPRRLSNSEYDNTIRDLIGYDIQPAKEFPVDPASGEGFNNTGEALIVSPSLFKKYLAAAEQVAEHAVLTTQGLRFAPHSVVTFADRQKFYEQAIIRFYDSHAVNHEKLFASLWRYKHRPAEQKSSSVEQWAEQSGHSAKYARMLWDVRQIKLTNSISLGFALRWNSSPKPADSGPATIEPINAIRGLVADLQRLSLRVMPDGNARDCRQRRKWSD